MKKPGQLTEKMRRFVAAYGSTGNATESARIAGYGSPGANAAKLLKHGAVQQELAKLRQTATSKAVMTRVGALELLTQIADGTIKATELSLSGEPVDVEVAPKDRIAAIKQLAKMEGWEAAQQHEHSGALTLIPATEEAAAEALRREAAKSPALQARLKLLVGGA